MKSSNLVSKADSKRVLTCLSFAMLLVMTITGCATGTIRYQVQKGPGLNPVGLENISQLEPTRRSRDEHFNEVRREMQAKAWDTLRDTRDRLKGY